MKASEGAWVMKRVTEYKVEESSIMKKERCEAYKNRNMHKRKPGDIRQLGSGGVIEHDRASSRLNT